MGMQNWCHEYNQDVLFEKNRTELMAELSDNIQQDVFFENIDKFFKPADYDLSKKERAVFKREYDTDRMEKIAYLTNELLYCDTNIYIHSDVIGNFRVYETLRYNWRKKVILGDDKVSVFYDPRRYQIEIFAMLYNLADLNKFDKYRVIGKNKFEKQN